MNKITTFSTFGSCSSRNIFNSRINKSYKDYFQINKSVEGSTLISLMSDPVEYDLNLINSDFEYDNICIVDDLSKNFLNFVEKDFVDYIILDTFFDVTSNIIFYDKHKFISSHSRLKKVDFYNLIHEKRSINIFDNFHEYYDLWVKSCNKFFNFIDNKCNHSKIILNCSRLVYKYSDDGNILKNGEFEKLANKINPFMDLLDAYILENFDVDVLKFDFNTYLDYNHVFGIHPTHYEEKYYLEKNHQLLKIIRNNELGFNNLENVNFHKIQKDDLIKNFKLKKFNFDDMDTFEKKRDSIQENIENSLRKFNTARIDIKNNNLSNENTHLNNVLIDNYSDLNMLYYYPDWFKNAQGSGLMINSEKNFLKFDIIIEGDGELIIYLRSNDFRLLNGERIPIYINFLNFSIDGELIFTENKIVDHDHPYIYKQDVVDGQKLTLYFEWMPY